TLLLTARPLREGGAVLALLDLTAMRRLEAVRRDFVANVSHELKTPLTVIGGFAETLAEDDPPPDQRRRFVEAIRTNAQRMQRLVDDLLDLSRIESGGWQPNVGRVDVRAVLTDTATAIEQTAARKGVRVLIDIQPGAEEMSADPLAVRQVVSNLAENAVRHTMTGSATLFARRHDGGVDVGVRDTGTGIAPEHLPRIFERFYRADPSRSRAEGGTGLGLAIVKHLVEAHGGHVTAASTPGKGTEVVAHFPTRS
ncbi:MAG TPA: ATP-binding protein, partial [Gemmatimonadaceae bacterium]|nr:ATP-binding protein [Gemmatimonadaceae bacterium]